jgi:hypothetical protein
LTGQSDAGWFIRIISGSNGRHLVYRFNSVTLNTCIVASNGMSDETSYAYSTSGGWSSNGSSGGVTWLSWFFDFSSYTCTGTFDEDFAFIASYYRSSSVSWSQGIINCWLEEPTSTF